MKKTPASGRDRGHRAGGSAKARDLKTPELTEKEAARIVGGFASPAIVQNLPGLRNRLNLLSTGAVEYGGSIT